MNPEIKKQWVDALRSGKYLQGRGRLRRTAEKLGISCRKESYRKYDQPLVDGE